MIFEILVHDIMLGFRIDISRNGKKIEIFERKRLKN